MEKNRLEAFSDGVLAIVITIMVLELKVPEGDTFADLVPTWPTMLAYVLSFLFVAVYWVNHHMLFTKVKRVNVRILWSNIAWLFVMSLIPFTSAWVGSHPASGLPLSLYFADMALVAAMFHLLYYLIVKEQGETDLFHHGIRSYISLGTYVLVAIVAGFCPIAAYITVAAVTIWWAFPQKNKEKKEKEDNPS